MPPKENSHGDQFPVGMRVLAIDANFVCLKYLVTVLQQCRYKGFSFFPFSNYLFASSLLFCLRTTSLLMYDSTYME